MNIEDRKMNKIKPEEKYLPVLKCLVFILDWEKANVLTGLFERTKVRFHFIAHAKGTANSEMLNLLGLGMRDKAVFFCLEQDCMVPALLKEAGKVLGFYQPGAGIAFSIPLSGINNPLLTVFKKSVDKELAHYSEKETDIMDDAIQYELIVAVVNQGYSDELMAAAREAGAGGGTVINARGLMHQGPVRFFGISVQEEKEIIIILAKKEHKLEIMKVLTRDFGVMTKAAGIVFSLPVDTTIGLK
jgi:uncharacterized protein YaaQ